MSMIVARMQKMKAGNLSGIQRHNQREFLNHSNKDIDPTRTEKNYDLVVSDCIVVDENLQVLENSFFYLRNSGKGIIKNLYKRYSFKTWEAFSKFDSKWVEPTIKYIQRVWKKQ